MAGMQYILDFLDQANSNARAQVLRLSKSHSQMGLISTLTTITIGSKL